MPLRASSTADIDTAALRAFEADLSPEIEVEVDESQIFLRSAEPPSWVQFFADAPWWIQLFGAYASLYVAELVKEAAKTTWQERATLMQKTKDTAGHLTRFATRLATLRRALPARSQLVLGLPVPDDHFGVRFELLGRDEDVLAAEIAVFASFIPALERLIDAEGLRHGRVVGAINLLVTDDLCLRVTWMDGKSLSIREHVLRHAS